MRLLLLVAASILIAGMLALDQRSHYFAEQSTLRAIEATPDPYIPWRGTIEERVVRQKAGPQLLRQLLGEGLFKVGDRVVEITTSGTQLADVVKLRHLKVVRMHSVSNPQMALLADLPELEALHMNFVGVNCKGSDSVGYGEILEDQYLRLPPMPKLRGLNLWEATYFRGDGLENIPSIEVLDLTSTNVSDDSANAIMSLKHLKVLWLYDTPVSDACIARLRDAMPHCLINP